MEEDKDLDRKIDRQALKLAALFQNAKSSDDKLDIANQLALLILASMSTDQSRAQKILTKLRSLK